MKIQKLYPVCKDYIWGGTGLKTKYGKKCAGERCAESWELSFLDEGLTRLSSGETLESRVAVEDIGNNALKKRTFPLLIKLIDAADNLSVQVHPNDQYALRKENSLGKTEMWYVVEAEENAGIYLGLKESTTKECLLQAITDGTVTELLNFQHVKAGESYFVPAGTLHSICKGCLMLEIQQSSNITYRVYDYDRVDASGNKRELHVDKALDVACLDKYVQRRFEKNVLGECEYFSVSEEKVNGKRDMSLPDDSFYTISCVKGSGYVDDTQVFTCETLFVPAMINQVTLDGDMTLVVTHVPD